ncbi:hypothetical protein DWG18_10060 [Lysobacter sp. TY2-98]|uniref:hypothetical protein n=1 Tax=Lysobacter sp. TY2-98 TaxID=2290922 RepID=UPI000E200BE1|nr:hypothetical protein [Lysobacter sp. TY2-98]AXK72584.1 hypothetical protein DWG18_10060 [Lysobacter sp. TY2-98]
MNMHDDDFDARARAVHAASLDQLSARVNAQLAQRRRLALKGEARGTSRRLLPWAGVATAGLALALVVQLRPPGSGPAAPQSTGREVVATATTPAAPTNTSTTARVTPSTAPRIAAITPKPVSRLPGANDAEAVAPDLSEDPEFYMWLGDERSAQPE